MGRWKPSLFRIWFRIKTLPSLLAMFVSLLGCFLGLYLLFLGSRNTKIQEFNVLGYTVTEMQILDIRLMAHEVTIVAGVVIFMAGLSVILRLTSSKATLWAGA